MSDESLTQEPDPVAIPASDEALLAECSIDTFRAGGKGGQHQNKTESGVRLTHVPTGVTATARTERSQHKNKTLALARLRKKLERLNARPLPRISTRVPRAEKRKRREEKARLSRKKALRRKPSPEED